MIQRIFRIIIASGFCIGGMASADLQMPEDIKSAFRQAAVGESGGLSLNPDDQELVTGYVKTHWRDLLDHLDEVPSRSGSVRAATSVVGYIAEELPPMDYLDFLDYFLTIYANGEIKDNLLRAQLAGSGRKNYFLTVNHSHPRVQAILLRAKDLVPKENFDFHTYLDQKLRGDGADMYMANRGVNSLPPETLPGIKLRTPFESLIEKAKRLGKLDDGNPVRPTHGNSKRTNPTPAEVAGEAKGKGRLWASGAALAVLAIAIWWAFARKRFAKSSS